MPEARAVLGARRMWMNEDVDGDIAVRMPELLRRLAALETRWTSHGEWRRLRELVDEMIEQIDVLPAHLPPYADAMDSPRDRARSAYLATLELAGFLDEAADERWADLLALDRAHAVLHDLLQQWRPYISIDDAALLLVRLDGFSFADALEHVRAEQASATELDPDFELDDLDYIHDDCGDGGPFRRLAFAGTVR